jgi:TIR domain-containing protein/WD40 repeat protein
MSKDVFISHATEDQATAAEVCALLETRGVQCWIAPRDVAPGAQWDDAIVDAIGSAQTFLLILSAKANDSPYVKNEVNHAFGARKTIFTFRVEEVVPGKSLGFYLARHHWMDGFPPPLDTKVDALAAAISADIAQAGTAQGAGVATAVARPPRKLSWLASVHSTVKRLPRRERLLWALVGAFVVAVAALAIPAARHLRQSTPDPLPVRFEIATPPTSDPLSFALSPDGRQLAYVATTDGVSRLWVRQLDQVTAQPLRSTERAANPFWSPDGTAIGFFADSKLKRIDLGGAAPQVLANTTETTTGGTWNRDGVIVFGSFAVGLMRVAATGGTPVAVTRRPGSPIVGRSFCPMGAGSSSP